ncbi:MAG: hypothetical protein AAB152_11280 [Candidatus Coatesbacteria bacterium]
MTPAVLLLLIAAARADEAGLSGVSIAPETPRAISAQVVRDVRADFQAETDKAMRGAWAWATVTLSSGIYAGVVLAGHGGNDPALKYLSFVGVLAGLVGTLRSGARAHTMGALGAGLDEGLNASAGESSVRLSPGLVMDANAELHHRRNQLRNASRGALRAGCVLPVLLGGIGFYGLTVSSAGGDELAGVGLGGAIVIGGPAMLSYFGLQERLKRTERLVDRWDNALLGQEMTQ